MATEPDQVVEHGKEHVEPPTVEEARAIRERPITGPDEGFGQLWRKVYRIQLRDSSATAREVIATWKERFPDFWPPGNEFFAPLRGIKPGEMALIKLEMPGEGELTTGVYVLESGPTSFTLLTPKGHMFAGRIEFRATDHPDGTIVEVDVRLRANDPLYELGLMSGGHKHENIFWSETLQRVAAAFGVAAPVSLSVQLLDRRRQWSKVTNLRYNDAVRSFVRTMTHPATWLARVARRLTGGEPGRGNG